jgi:hypothetical protein
MRLDVEQKLMFLITGSKMRLEHGGGPWLTVAITKVLAVEGKVFSLYAKIMVGYLDNYCQWCEGIKNMVLYLLSRRLFDKM